MRCSMAHKDNKNFHDEYNSPASTPAAISEDPLSDTGLTSRVVPPGIDRRAFIMRSAAVGAAAIMTGRSIAAQEKLQAAATAPSPVPPLDPNLNVVKKGQGPVMTVIDEFYKVGPGPSSS